MRISIHAPSRERPYLSYRQLKLQLISIHAPSRERLIFAGVPDVRSDFNPRSLAGATIEMFRTGSYNRISIHAPSRERQRFRHLH